MAIVIKRRATPAAPTTPLEALIAAEAAATPPVSEVAAPLPKPLVSLAPSKPAASPKPNATTTPASTGPAPAVSTTAPGTVEAPKLKVAVPPWEEGPSTGSDYNILDALKELADGRPGQLYLTKDFTDTAYEVVHYDPHTCQARLKTVSGGFLTPVVGMREAMLYSPSWR